MCVYGNCKVDFGLKDFEVTNEKIFVGKTLVF